MIFNEKMECATRDAMKDLQSKRLKRLISFIYDRSPVYRKKFRECKVNPSDIKSIDDISKLPFTVKEDMRDNYPFKLFSTKVKDVREIHVSSGTTGNPTVVGYSDDDLDLWGEVMARSLACAGARPGDMVQIAYGYGLFTGGLGCHYGSLKLKLTVLPMSSGNTMRQLKLMQDFRPRILCCTPSYALFMLDEAKQLGIDPKKSSWEIGVFGAEPWTNAMRDEIEKSWNILATDIYGLSEIIGPGVAQECRHKNGLHLYQDVFYPEVINPDTNEPVKDGEYGELVITTLTKTAVPLIRYRTRDIVSISYKKCPCGRTTPRISKVRGRTDDMIIVRGINVFPTQIEHVLLKTEGTAPHYQLIVDRSPSGLDSLEVLVEMDEKFFSDKIADIKSYEDKICHEIQSTLSVGAKVRLVEPMTIQRSEGKAKRVVDKRNLSQ